MEDGLTLIDTLARPPRLWAGLRLRLRDGDLPTLDDWIIGRVKVLGLDSRQDFEDLLRQQSAMASRERELLSVRFSTGETYFFRDTGQLDLLAETILPELIKRRAKDRRLRIWSAGCATGEEVYSLAMLIAEAEESLKNWDVAIIGTDINGAALEKARTGVYSPWSFRALDAGRKQRYFSVHGTELKVTPQLREIVSFQQLDLAHDHFSDSPLFESGLDLILCRNVFIYLTAPVVTDIVAKFSQVLAEGGYLMTGHSELLGHPLGALRTRVHPGSLIFEKVTVMPAAGNESRTTISVNAPQTTYKISRPIAGPSCVSAPQGSARAQPATTNIDNLMQLAWANANRGEADQALEACRKAITQAVFDPRPYYLRAQLAQERGDTAEARTLLQKVVYLDPGYLAAYLDLGAMEEQADSLQNARRMYMAASRALEKLPPHSVLSGFGGSQVIDALGFVEGRIARIDGLETQEQPATQHVKPSRRAHG